MFGCASRNVPQRRPRIVAVRKGGRSGGTSHLLIPKALHAAWTTPLPSSRRGEHADVLLVAPDRDFTKQLAAYCRGYLSESPILRSSVEDVPLPEASEGIDRLGLRRPDGHLVFITFCDTARNKAIGRHRQTIFVGFDEANFFTSNNDTSDVRNSLSEEFFCPIITRVEPEGQAWFVSSPWVEHVGFMEGLMDANFGNHRDALVATAGTRLLNPQWDPLHTIEAQMRGKDVQKAMREIDAIPMAMPRLQGIEPVHGVKPEPNTIDESALLVRVQLNNAIAAETISRLRVRLSDFALACTMKVNPEEKPSLGKAPPRMFDLDDALRICEVLAKLPA